MSLFRTSANVPVAVPRYTGLQVQTASSALPIPIVYGTTRIAPNLIWSGSFASHPQYSRSSGGKGGGGDTNLSGYTYSTALVFALGEGPIGSIGTIWRGNAVHRAADLFLTLYTGTTPQDPWGYLSASFPPAALAYAGTAYAATSVFDLGGSASIGSIAFEVAGRLAGTAPANGKDADPALVLQDVLTNPQYGIGFPAQSLASVTGASGDGSYQTWCRAAGLALSPALTDGETASAILSRWLKLTCATAVWSGGRLRIVPLADAPANAVLPGGATIAFAPNLAPVMDLTDENFVLEPDGDPVLVTRADPHASANLQRLEILDRTNAYSATPVEARDQNAIETDGLRPGATGRSTSPATMRPTRRSER